MRHLIVLPFLVSVYFTSAQQLGFSYQVRMFPFAQTHSSYEEYESNTSVKVAVNHPVIPEHVFQLFYERVKPESNVINQFSASVSFANNTFTTTRKKPWGSMYGPDDWSSGGTSMYTVDYSAAYINLKYGTLKFSDLNAPVSIGGGVSGSIGFMLFQKNTNPYFQAHYISGTASSYYTSDIENNEVQDTVYAPPFNLKVEFPLFLRINQPKHQIQFGFSLDLSTSSRGSFVKESGNISFTPQVAYIYRMKKKN